MKKLFENSKRLSAIRQIISGMKEEHISETDQQYKEALSQEDKATTALLSTIRETFITLYYPTKGGLSSDDFKLEFAGNKFIGEDQIVRTLIDASKFQDYSKEDRFMETLRKKCEARIFTQHEMTWSQIMERAGTEVNWQWYHPDQMEDLKKDCFNRDKWREVGGYIQKGPFAKEPTEVSVEQLSYDEGTGEFTLKVRGVYGNTVYYDVGAEPTEASAIVPTPFITRETDLWFLCVDQSHDDPHPTGDAKHFMCKVPLRAEQREAAVGTVMQLATHPGFEVRYTTDGSNPKESGGKYSGEFVIPKGCKYVRTAVYNHGELVEEKDIPITEQKSSKKAQIDDEKGLEYTLKSMKKCPDTASAYSEFGRLQKLAGTYIRHFTVVITEKNQADNYMEITTARVPYDASNLQATVDIIRESAFANKDVVVEFEYKSILFTKGAIFKQWVDMNKLDMNELTNLGEIIQ